MTHIGFVTLNCGHCFSSLVFDDDDIIEAFCSSVYSFA